MIETLGNALAEDLFDDKRTKATRSFPTEIRRAGRRKLLYLHDAGELKDLEVPPGNRLKSLKGNWIDFYSIRINNQWRVVFSWVGGNAFEVQVLDYH